MKMKIFHLKEHFKQFKTASYIQKCTFHHKQRKFTILRAGILNERGFLINL